MTENERKRTKYAELSIEERRVKIQKKSHANKMARERKRIENEVLDKDNAWVHELHETQENGTFLSNHFTDHCYLFIIQNKIIEQTIFHFL